MRREWLVLIAVTIALLFGSGTTFASMGIPLFAMAEEFHWSQAGAGAAFLATGVMCAVASMAPMLLIPYIGGRWTMVAGSLLLAVGFVLSSAVHTLSVFYVAAAIFGLAFALVANASGTYLVANWFGERAGRMIGVYMMVGTLGDGILPPVAGALTAGAGGWRFYWTAMAGVAVLVAILCATLIREPPNAIRAAVRDPAVEGWNYRRFLTAPQFVVLAAAIVGTQFVKLVVSADIVPHFAAQGWSAEYGARILGLHGLVGAVATGVSGWLTERYEPKFLLAGALLLETLGMLLLAFAHSLWMTYAFVPIFGIGWSVATLAATVLLIRYFGNNSGTAALSAIWMLAGFSTAGPSLSGYMADVTGGFVPALSLFGLILVPIAIAALMMNPHRQTAKSPATAIPAEGRTAR
jgi:MFS family permease